MAKKKKEKKAQCPISFKPLEGTILKYRGKKEKEGRCPIWIKEEHIEYEIELKKLQIELMKLQKSMKANGDRILAIFEGRDAAGKGGTIKRITAFLNPRNVRVVALANPSDKEFLKDVPLFEELLVKDGIKLFKFYFSVSKDEQARRFESRKTDLLKQYKLSPVDNLAQQYWDQYSVKKFQMLNESNRTIAPWTIIRSDNKKMARLNCMKHILSNLDYSNKLPQKELRADPKFVISGIDEIKHMEKNLLNPNSLRG
jgi:polyphosphate kinase 2 (PPK2 family)